MKKTFTISRPEAAADSLDELFVEGKRLAF